MDRDDETMQVCQARLRAGVEEAHEDRVLLVHEAPPAGVDEKDVAAVVDVAQQLASAAEEPVLVALLERLDECLVKYEATALQYLLNTFEEHQGLDLLEALQAHASHAVYERCVRLLETFFAAEEEDDDDYGVDGLVMGVPPATANPFAVGNTFAF